VPVTEEAMLHLLTIVGARPQFIKAAAVSRAIREHNAVLGDIMSSCD
jgi:UDP-N-acetylglucosamine 2-epimerase